MASLRVKPKNLLFPLWSTPRSCEDRSREAPSNAPRRLVILEQALVHFPQCSFEANLRLFQSWTEPINPRHSMGLPYMPTLTPLAPPQLIGIYGIHGVSGNTNPFQGGGRPVCPDAGPRRSMSASRVCAPAPLVGTAIRLEPSFATETLQHTHF